MEKQNGGHHVNKMAAPTATKTKWSIILWRLILTSRVSWCLITLCYLRHFLSWRWHGALPWDVAMGCCHRALPWDVAMVRLRRHTWSTYDLMTYFRWPKVTECKKVNAYTNTTWHEESAAQHLFRCVRPALNIIHFINCIYNLILASYLKIWLGLLVFHKRIFVIPTHQGWVQLQWSITITITITRLYLVSITITITLFFVSKFQLQWQLQLRHTYKCQLQLQV